MSKFNRDAQPAPPVARAGSPLGTVVSPQLSGAMPRITATPDTVTYEGGAGYTRNARTELFLACTSSFITEKSFYESADERTSRVAELVHQVVVEDGGPSWLLDFVTWLRGPEGNIRTAAIVVAAEAVRGRRTARRDRKTTGIAGALNGEPETLRRIVAAALQRADEPGELLAYWTVRYGQPLPNSIKRGVADAAARLYTEHATLKYDTAKASIRFGDVVALTRPTPPVGKAVLFRHLIERRHPDWRDSGEQRLGDRGIPDSLEMLRARKALEAIPVEHRREYMLTGATDTAPASEGAFRDMLREAGATWEYVSGWLADGKGMDAAAWEAVIPSMGYMALIRNLRNFDEAGVSDAVAEQLAAKIADPEQVAKSRQFPFRFLSAYEAAPSDRWKLALGKALGHSMRNLPELNGSTLIMVDTSASMRDRVSDKSQRQMVDVAALFGIALTYRNIGKVGLYGFANHEFKHNVTLGGSVLGEMSKFFSRIGEAGHGTEIEQSTIRAFGSGYDRVIVLSDMQSFGDRPVHGHWQEAAFARGMAGLSERIPAHVPIYAFDLSSYAAGVIPAGGAARFQLGGLSDSTFRMIPQVEAGLTGSWPWAD
jgi:TROVE domain-containing protein